MITARSLALLGTLALLACSSSKPAAEAPAPNKVAELPARAWTTRFEQSAVLAARVVEIVGPKGLLEHLAIGRDSDNHEYREAATSEGLRIECAQRADSDGAPIRVQLDNLVIAVDERLLVIERPGDTDVVVEASGDVYFHEGGDEQRSTSLRLVGSP